MPQPSHLKHCLFSSEIPTFLFPNTDAKKIFNFFSHTLATNFQRPVSTYLKANQHVISKDFYN